MKILQSRNQKADCFRNGFGLTGEVQQRREKKVYKTDKRLRLEALPAYENEIKAQRQVAIKLKRKTNEN